MPCRVAVAARLALLIPALLAPGVSEAAERPPRGDASLCAPDTALCVHGSALHDGATLPTVLDAARRARVALAPWSLPPALPDGGRGGSHALDIYLETGHGAAAYADPWDGFSSFDRGSAFGRLGRSAGDAAPCALEAALARVMVQASLLGLDARIHDGVLALHASHIASLATPCPAVETAAIDDFQRQPERALSSWPRGAASGAMLWSSYLDREVGKRRDGTLLTNMLALSPQAANAGRNEPDLFDTLRRLLDARGKPRFDQAMLDFAVERAFVGDRADGVHGHGSEHHGRFGRPRFDWSLPYDSLPRRVAPPRPVEPSGASYLWLDLAGAPRGAAVSLHVRWEESFVYAWSIVKVDRNGVAVGRVDAEAVWGRDELQLSAHGLDDLAGVVVVATSLGSDDREHPFDPDAGPPQGSSFELTLRRL
jgi:hypothetical protein